MTGVKFVFALLCAVALEFSNSQAAVLDFKEILDAGTPKIQVFLDNVLQNTFTGEKVEDFKFTSTVRAPRDAVFFRRLFEPDAQGRPTSVVSDILIDHETANSLDYTFDFGSDPSLLTPPAGAREILPSSPLAEDGTLQELLAISTTVNGINRVIDTIRVQSERTEGGDSKVPEPGSLILLLTGVAGLGLVRWKLHRRRDLFPV